MTDQMELDARQMNEADRGFRIGITKYQELGAPMEEIEERFLDILEEEFDDGSGQSYGGTSRKVKRLPKDSPRRGD